VSWLHRYGDENREWYARRSSSGTVIIFHARRPPAGSSVSAFGDIGTSFWASIINTILSVCRKSSFCAVSLLMLCGFQAVPDCASDDTKRTVVAIVKEYPPVHLLAIASEAWSAKQKQEIEKECGKHYTEVCTDIPQMT
jgi:hypothetical protein